MKSAMSVLCAIGRALVFWVVSLIIILIIRYLSLGWLLGVIFFIFTILIIDDLYHS